MPEDQNITPVDSGDADNTPPVAVTAGTTPTPGGGNETQVDIDKIVQKRLDRERKKWEADAEERAKRARMDEADRLKAELADKDKEIAAAKADAIKARQVAALTGRVVDAEDALAIAERAGLVDDDGTVNLDELLKTKPYLAASDMGGRSTTPAANAARLANGTKPLTPDDFRGKDPAWIDANLHRLAKP
ncbi:MAG TPA: DUF4355 domain-containing protein [Trueperaceae bacterium]|nr:DUF4355 domain-containing protein [Trueperaceae bacterium]